MLHSNGSVRWRAQFQIKDGGKRGSGKSCRTFERETLDCRHSAPQWKSVRLFRLAKTWSSRRITFLSRQNQAQVCLVYSSRSHHTEQWNDRGNCYLPLQRDEVSFEFGEVQVQDVAGRTSTQPGPDHQCHSYALACWNFHNFKLPLDKLLASSSRVSLLGCSTNRWNIRQGLRVVLSALQWYCSAKFASCRRILNSFLLRFHNCRRGYGPREQRVGQNGLCQDQFAEFVAGCGRSRIHVLWQNGYTHQKFAQF